VFGIIRAMCESCFTAGDFRCSGPAACWRAPMPQRRTDGTAVYILPLKKSPLATLGADLHRRSQLPARFDPARYLEPSGLPTGSSRDGKAQEREDFGAIELWHTQFDYRQDKVFNAATYLGFLEQLARRYRRRGAILIQDNASYHKDGEVWAWFKSNRHWLEVHQLPPYSGTESNGTALAAHPQERNAQPFLRRTGRPTRDPDARLQEDAVAASTDPVLSGSFLLIIMSL
jgi:hypothetical protein